MNFIIRSIIYALGILVPYDLYLVFVWAPPAKWPGANGTVLGHIQKIFYYHVSAAWVMFVGMFLAMAFSILYLRTGRKKWDLLAYVNVKLALLFGVIAILMGSIWAKPAWGVFWTWDPRLTTMAVALLFYAGYMTVRGMMEDNPEARARISSYIAIIGFLNVPATFLSIRLWRSIHPVIIEGSEKSGLSPEMQFVLWITLITVLLLYIVLHYFTYKTEVIGAEERD